MKYDILIVDDVMSFQKMGWDGMAICRVRFVLSYSQVKEQISPPRVARFLRNASVGWFVCSC